MNVNKPKRPSKYYMEKIVELLLEKENQLLFHHYQQYIVIKKMLIY